MNMLEMRASDCHNHVTHPKARKVNDSYKNSPVYNVPMHIILLQEHGILYHFFFTWRCRRIVLPYQGEAVCQSDVCSVAEKYPLRSDCLSADDTLWQVSPQASPIWHIGELMKEWRGLLKWFRQHGWQLGDGKKKLPSEALEKSSTSSLGRGQSYEKSVLTVPSWAATGSSIWCLSSFSPYSETSSHGIPRDDLSLRTIKDRWLSLPVLEKMWDVKERWRLILWGIFCLREDSLFFCFCIFRWYLISGKEIV